MMIKPALLFTTLVLTVLSAACGESGRDGSSKSDPPQALTEASSIPFAVDEPVAGATIDTKEIIVRGSAPPGADVRRDTAGPDPKAKADADGRWEMTIKLDKAGPVELRFFLEKQKDQRVTMTLTYAPPATTAPARAEKPKEHDVTTPTFAVNTARVGCHEKPEEKAKVIVQREPGVVQAMDRVIEQADGTWHREKDRKCWTRTAPGPVEVFTTLDEANAAAEPLRPRPSPAGAGTGASPGTTGAPATTRQPSQSETDAAAPCRVGQIKGNISSKIYHAPRQQDYAKTKVNVACYDTAQQAEAAGYRPAQR